jgi:hypothetical protein
MTNNKIIKIVLKPFNDNISDKRYKIVQLDNAVSVHAGKTELFVSGGVSEAEAKLLLQERHHRVTVKE